MKEWIKLVCDHCGVKLKIQVEYEGKRGKCPKCQTRCVIEDDLVVLDDSVVEDIGMDMDADTFDIDADLFAEFEAIDADIEKKKKDNGKTQVVNHNWESGTKINIKEFGL